MINKIAGKVVEEHTEKGIPNVIVEAVKKGDVSGENLGFAVTDKDGRFVIAHDEDTLEEHILDADPAIYLNVFNSDGTVMYTGKELIKWNTSEVKVLPIKVPYSLLGGVSVLATVVNRRDGGRLVHPHGLALVIEPNSLAADAYIEIERLEDAVESADDFPALGPAFRIHSSEATRSRVRVSVRCRQSEIAQTEMKESLFLLKVKQEKVTKLVASKLVRKTEQGEMFFAMEASLKLPRRKSVTIEGSVLFPSVTNTMYHPVPHYFKIYELGTHEDGSCRREGSDDCSVPPPQAIYPACLPTARARLFGAYQLLLPPKQRRWYAGTPANPDPDPEEHGDHFSTAAMGVAAASEQHAVHLDEWRTGRYIEIDRHLFDIGDLIFSLSLDYEDTLQSGVVVEELKNEFAANALDLPEGLTISELPSHRHWRIDHRAISVSYLIEKRNNALKVYVCDLTLEDAMRERARLLKAYLNRVVGGAGSWHAVAGIEPKPVYIHHKGHGWNIVGVDARGYWSHGQSPTEALSAWTDWENAPWANEAMESRYYGTYEVWKPKNCRLKPEGKRVGSISTVGSGGKTNRIQFVDLPSGKSIDWTPHKELSSVEIGYGWIEDGCSLNARGIPNEFPIGLWDDELGYRIPVPENDYEHCSCNREDGCSRCRTRLHLPFWVHNTTLDQRLRYKVDLHYWAASGRWLSLDAHGMEPRADGTFAGFPDWYPDKYDLPGPQPGEAFEIAATPDTTPDIETKSHPLNWQPILWRVDFHKDQLKKWNTHGVKLVLTCLDNCLVQDIVQIWFKTQIEAPY
jgi:hypothetical protein